jgi:hypothetical protein
VGSRRVSIELWFLGGSLLVSAFRGDVESEPANAGLSHNQVPARELERDLAFIFCAVGFENCGVPFNSRRSAALVLIRRGAVGCFVFPNSRELDLQFLLLERPDFEFVLSMPPCSVDLRGRNILLRVNAGRDEPRCENEENGFHVSIGNRLKAGEYLFRFVQGIQ